LTRYVLVHGHEICRSQNLEVRTWHLVVHRRVCLAGEAQTYSQSRLVENGYADPAHFRTRLERFTKGEECNEGQLRYLILLEFWLRSRDPRASMVQ
jgi:hypothetical protein